MFYFDFLIFYENFYVFNTVLKFNVVETIKQLVKSLYYFIYIKRISYSMKNSLYFIVYFLFRSWLIKELTKEVEIIILHFLLYK